MARSFMRPWQLAVEGPERGEPLRAGGGCLARDRRGGEVRLGIDRLARLGTVLVEAEQAPAAQMSFDAPDHALEQLTHLAGAQMAEPLPGELALALVAGAVEKDHVEVWLRRRSEDVRCTTLTAPVLASRAPCPAARVT